MERREPLCRLQQALPDRASGRHAEVDRPSARLRSRTSHAPSLPEADLRVRHPKNAVAAASQRVPVSTRAARAARRLALAIEGPLPAVRAARSQRNQAKEPVANRFGSKLSPTSIPNGWAGTLGEQRCGREIVEEHRRGLCDNDRTPEVDVRHQCRAPRPHTRPYRRSVPVVMMASSHNVHTTVETNSSPRAKLYKCSSGLAASSSSRHWRRHRRYGRCGRALMAITASFRRPGNLPLQLTHTSILTATSATGSTFRRDARSCVITQLLACPPTPTR